MRNLLVTGATLAALAAMPSAASAQYYLGGDPYGASPFFGYPPPPAYGYVTRAPLVQGGIYLAPGPTDVVPVAPYADQTVVIKGYRYYRDCWLEWGRRQCGFKAWW